MEQSFLLKEYGNLTLFEQAYMNAEDRAWWIKRLNEEKKRPELNNKFKTPQTGQK